MSWVDQHSSFCDTDDAGVHIRRVRRSKRRGPGRRNRTTGIADQPDAGLLVEPSERGVAGRSDRIEGESTVERARAEGWVLPFNVGDDHNMSVAQ